MTADCADFADEKQNGAASAVRVCAAYLRNQRNLRLTALGLSVRIYSGRWSKTMEKISEAVLLAAMFCADWDGSHILRAKLLGERGTRRRFAQQLPSENAISRPAGRRGFARGGAVFAALDAPHGACRTR